MGSKYVRNLDSDAEKEDRNRNPELFHCGSSVMTSAEFLRDLENWLATRHKDTPAKK
jgi:hypothetical protein